MALPDNFQFNIGNAITWGDSGAAGVTSGAWLSFNALASAAGQMGQSMDLGSLFAMDWACILAVEAGGTAPASGTIAEAYLAFSYNNSWWPGFVSGANAAYPVTVDQNKRMLGTPVNIVTAVNTSNTLFVQAPTVFTPLGRYVSPVVVNLLGTIVRSYAAPSSGNSRLILYPLQGTVQD